MRAAMPYSPMGMTLSNSRAEFAAIYRRTRAACDEYEAAKSDLKKLVPGDAKSAIRHGLKAKRSNPAQKSSTLNVDAPTQGAVYLTVLFIGTC